MGYSIIIKPKPVTQQRLELPESDAMACPQLDIWICLDLAKNQRQARKIKTLTIIGTMTTTYTNAKNWLVQADLLAKSGLTDLIAGKDSGAGYGKAIIGDFSIMMPAAYSLVRNRNIMHHETISKDGAWVRYVQGTRLDLKDVQFFWGSAAIAQTDHTLLHEDVRFVA